MTSTYNGWANYETWLANLWLTNEEWSYNRSRAIAQEAAEDFEPIAELADYYTNPVARREGEITAAGEALEEWATDTFLDPVGAEGFVADLLGAAWGHIDWREIAEAFLSDTETR